MAKHTRQIRTGSGGTINEVWYDPGTAPWELEPNKYHTAEVNGGIQHVPNANWLERNLWWIAPAAIGTSGLAGLGGGGGTPLSTVGTATAPVGGAGTTAASVAPAVNWAAAPSTAGLFAPEGLVGTTAATAAAPAAGAVAPAAAAASTGGFWNTLKKIGGKLFGTDAGRIAVSSGTDLLAAKVAADAAKHAADQQFEFGMQALNFEKDRYKDAQGNLEPWIGAGKKALGAVGNALMPENGPAPTADNLAPRWISGLQANAQNNGRSLVSMRAPTGEVQQVPSFQVPHYQSAGAKVI